MSQMWFERSPRPTDSPMAASIWRDQDTRRRDVETARDALVDDYAAMLAAGEVSADEQRAVVAELRGPTPYDPPSFSSTPYGFSMVTSEIEQRVQKWASVRAGLAHLGELLAAELIERDDYQAGKRQLFAGVDYVDFARSFAAIAQWQQARLISARETKALVSARLRGADHGRLEAWLRAKHA